MAGTMYDYLTTKTPDYTTTTLEAIPSNQLTEDGGNKVQINESDSGALEAIRLSGSMTFTVDLEWGGTDAKVNSVMDFYLDPNKGASGARTIKWKHPLDGHVYCARFIGKAPRITMNKDSSIKATLRIEGYVS